MPNTTYGTPFVASSDLVSAYPGVSSTLATRVDNISLVGNGVNAQTASYTLVLTDGGKTITMTNAGATTITVPTEASVAFPVGVMVTVVNLGAGTCTVAGAGGVTVNGSSLGIAQYSGMGLLKTATNTWVAVPFSGGASNLTAADVSATTGSPTTTTSGGYRAYQYTGSGTITFSRAGFITVMVAAGGGGGGSGNTEQTGAGGGGGMTEQTISVDANIAYVVTVGGGGGAGSNGSNSSFGNVLVMSGGGRGGNARSQAGASGGSGGGGGDYGGAGGSGSSAQTPAGSTFATPQGYNGSAGGNDSPSPTTDGGSGGGAGGNASGNTAGVGRATTLTGSTLTLCAGARVQDGTGSANTGRGGGQNSSGGSGQVIVRVVA